MTLNEFHISRTLLLTVLLFHLS